MDDDDVWKMSWREMRSSDGAHLASALYTASSSQRSIVRRFSAVRRLTHTRATIESIGRRDAYVGQYSQQCRIKVGAIDAATLGSFEK